MTAVLVGGVSELYQGDLDLGRLAAEQLGSEHLGPDVTVEDFHYGAVAVAQRLQETSPETLVLIGAELRGRQPATLQRSRVRPRSLSSADAQAAVGDAVTGYVGIGLIVDVATAFGVLPPRTITVEFEPVVTAGVELSPQARAALPGMLEMVRAEVRRAPVLHVAAQIRERLETPPDTESAAVLAMQDLLRELEQLDEHGRWGAAFTHREHVQARIAAGQTPEGMEHLDWALWWALLEEIERLLPTEGIAQP